MTKESTINGQSINGIFESESELDINKINQLRSDIAEALETFQQLRTINFDDDAFDFNISVSNIYLVLLRTEEAILALIENFDLKSWTLKHINNPASSYNFYAEFNIKLQNNVQTYKDCIDYLYTNYLIKKRPVKKEVFIEAPKGVIKRTNSDNSLVVKIESLKDAFETVKQFFLDARFDSTNYLDCPNNRYLQELFLTHERCQDFQVLVEQEVTQLQYENNWEKLHIFLEESTTEFKHRIIRFYEQKELICCQHSYLLVKPSPDFKIHFTQQLEHLKEQFSKFLNLLVEFNDPSTKHHNNLRFDTINAALIEFIPSLFGQLDTVFHKNELKKIEKYLLKKLGKEFFLDQLLKKIPLGSTASKVDDDVPTEVELDIQTITRTIFPESINWKKIDLPSAVESFSAITQSLESPLIVELEAYCNYSQNFAALNQQWLDNQKNYVNEFNAAQKSINNLFSDLALYNKLKNQHQIKYSSDYQTSLKLLKEANDRLVATQNSVVDVSLNLDDNTYESLEQLIRSQAQAKADLQKIVDTIEPAKTLLVQLSKTYQTTKKSLETRLSVQTVQLNELLDCKVLPEIEEQSAKSLEIDLNSICRTFKIDFEAFCEALGEDFEQHKANAVVKDIELEPLLTSMLACNSEIDLQELSKFMEVDLETLQGIALQIDLKQLKIERFDPYLESISLRYDELFKHIGAEISRLIKETENKITQQVVVVSSLVNELYSIYNPFADECAANHTSLKKEMTALKRLNVYDKNTNFKQWFQEANPLTIRLDSLLVKRITLRDNALEIERRLETSHYKLSLEIQQELEQEYMRLVNKHFNPNKHLAISFNILTTSLYNLNAFNEIENLKSMLNSVDPRLIKLKTMFNEFSTINQAYISREFKDYNDDKFFEDLKSTIKTHLLSNNLHQFSEGIKNKLTILLNRFYLFCKSKPEADTSLKMPVESIFKTKTEKRLFKCAKDGFEFLSKPEFGG